MITLTGGGFQNASGLFVANGAVSFSLNCDATVIAAPYGLVSSEIPVVFQLDGNGNLIQPCKLYSNKELNPQNLIGLGTYYLVTFYDQNGSRLNQPMWWQFPEAAGVTVNISNMTPVSTVGGNVIFYPTPSLGGNTTVTQLTVAAPNAGPFQVAHDLGQAPDAASILETLPGGSIYWQNPPWDATYLYLVASDAGLNCIVQLWT
jgi:hypothetical protein